LCRGPKSTEAGPVDTGQFRIIFVLTGLLPLLSALGFPRLPESNSADVSGCHVPARREAVAD